MRKLLLCLLLSCATVGNYNEGDCPSMMSREEHASGSVRCRALCSSYARDFDYYTDKCECVCKKQNQTKQQPGSNYTNQM